MKPQSVNWGDWLKEVELVHFHFSLRDECCAEPKRKNKEFVTLSVGNRIRLKVLRVPLLQDWLSIVAVK